MSERASERAWPTVVEALHAVLGAEQVVSGDALQGRRFGDWSGSPTGLPLALILPRTPREVAQALEVCTRYAQPVSVQGGLTGLAGGANPVDGEIVLSLSRLNQVEELDEMGGTALVQAGVTLERLQAAAEEKGWFFPLDLGARGTCQVGGNAATNAGGNRVVRFGMMRESVLGLEVALADGTLLPMLDRVIKNNAGFDLKQLFIGSEGTLGIITRLVVKLVPRPASRSTVLCAVPDFPAAATLLREARRGLPDLTAFELMWHEYLAASAAAQRRPLPFADVAPLYVLMETLSGNEAAGSAAIEQFLGDALERGWIADAVIAQSIDQANQFWELREGVSELLPALHPFVAFDVSVALPQMEEFVADLRTRLTREYPAQRHLFFGHLGDGNLHLLSGPFNDASLLEPVEHLVYQAVAAVGGSVSAEHGIGTVKLPFLAYSRDAAAIALMQRLKATLDPLRLLNRGRVLAFEDH